MSFANYQSETGTTGTRVRTSALNQPQLCLLAEPGRATGTWLQQDRDHRKAPMFVVAEGLDLGPAAFSTAQMAAVTDRGYKKSALATQPAETSTERGGYNRMLPGSEKKLLTTSIGHAYRGKRMRLPQNHKSR